MESLSIWSLAGVVLNSAVITAVRLSTQRVWHTFNYDITISNGVNLCHPGLMQFSGLKSQMFCNSNQTISMVAATRTLCEAADCA